MPSEMPAGNFSHSIIPATNIFEPMNIMARDAL